MIVVSLDPGGTTGAVVVDWNGDISPEPETSPLLVVEQVPFDLMPMWFDNVIREHSVGLVVIERFFISERTVRTTRQPEAMYVIGGVMFMASLADIPVRMQAASDAKSAFPNDRLVGWPVTGRHSKDALRHFLLSCLARRQ